MTLERAENAIAKDPTNGAGARVGRERRSAILGENEPGTRLESSARCCSIRTICSIRYNLACALASIRKPIRSRDRRCSDLFRRRGEPAQKSSTSRSDPDLDPIRDDPGFKQMLASAKQRLGIARKPRHA